MNQFIEHISNPGISISRNVIEDDDEDAYRVEELERDPAAEIEVRLDQELSCQLLVVCVAEPAAVFGRLCFGTSAAAHDKLAKAGDINIRGNSFGAIFTDASGTVLVEFPNKLQGLEEELSSSADVAYAVMEKIAPKKVVVLSSHLLAKYYPPEPEEEVEPPLVRAVATAAARESMSKRTDALPFLETGNLIRGLGPAFLTEAELRLLWGILVVSYQASRWFSFTLSGFLPVVDLLKIEGVKEETLCGTQEEMSERCAKTQEVVDVGDELLYL